MCGICGIFDLTRSKRADLPIVEKMIAKLRHRGPDQVDSYGNGNIAFGFSRLSIIDLQGGMQPLFNEDRSILMICNGEIFNYIELRQELINRGHRFKTGTDVEVILHLYEEKGTDFLNQLNGQFAFAVFDFRKHQLFCARGHFGIIPFFYTVVNDYFIFASEIKALLEHPQVKKEVDLVGLDQIFSFPGLISPRTMFKNIRSLENGHYLLVKEPGNIKDVEYWDVIYPENGETQQENEKDEAFYIEHLNERITQSVKLRLRSDVPVGFYISGGLDSSVICAKANQLTPHIRRFSFSIDFEQKEQSEARYQRIMADYIKSSHYEKKFFYSDISERLKTAVYHSEYPLKETYNTASLALSEASQEKNIKVVLSGEGADEWFAGYPGYKFDKFRQMKMQPSHSKQEKDPESEINQKLWGDEHLTFELNQHTFKKIKNQLYSPYINGIFDQIDSLQQKVVNKERLQNRHMLHKRSYLDYKLRLVSHLIADHGDRMAYANSVEGRYPFLDKDLVEFVQKIPPQFKLNEFNEKYILKKIAENQIPREIIKREKFAFHAPGSPYLLKRNIEYINDLISYENIKHQGYFNPDTVDSLKKKYSRDGFNLNVPYETDILIIVITFGIFLDVFEMPGL